MKLLFELFTSFFQIGILSFGGGYAAMPLIKEQVVDFHGWLTMAGFGDIITIAEMTPGPVAINCATFVGIQIAGIPGALVATAGCITPSCIIVTLLAYAYYRFRGLEMVKAVLTALRPAIIAMIASAGLTLLELSLEPGRSPVSFGSYINYVAFGIFLIAFCVSRRLKANPILVIAGSGILTLVVYGVLEIIP